MYVKKSKVVVKTFVSVITGIVKWVCIFLVGIFAPYYFSNFLLSLFNEYTNRNIKMFVSAVPTHQEILGMWFLGLSFLILVLVLLFFTYKMIGYKYKEVEKCEIEKYNEKIKIENSMSNDLSGALSNINHYDGALSVVKK